jgi:hypothetical protein
MPSARAASMAGAIRRISSSPNSRPPRMRVQAGHRDARRRHAEALPAAWVMRRV